VTFELGVLLAALAAFFGMLVINGLPRLHHPLFDAERFSLATRDRFFLYVPAAARDEDTAALTNRLRALGAAFVQEVEE
jgi:hypothetical protein